MFEALGLEVRLSIEPCWANAADELSYGLTDPERALETVVVAEEGILICVGSVGGLARERVWLPPAVPLER